MKQRPYRWIAAVAAFALMARPAAAAKADVGSAFDDNERVTLDGMRSDYGVEMRFYLPVFQAPLRLIYGFIQNPRRGEDSSSFLFSIGSTF